MAKFHCLLLFIILSSFAAAQNRWSMYGNSAYLAFLVSDYRTYKFQGGFFSEVPVCQDCNKDSIPLSIIYHSPIDFGDVIFTYKAASDTVFWGSIVWMGTGSIKKPEFILPADSFNIVNDSISPPLSVEYYKYLYYLSNDVFKRRADSAWNAVKNLDIVKGFSRHGYRIGISLYTPSVGVFTSEGPFWPNNSKWIIFLYRPRAGEGIKLSGKVCYDNNTHNPLDLTAVSLNPGNFTAVANKDGEYSIDGLSNGTYSINASSARIWRGVNATDALIIGRYINRLYPLNGLKLKAGDADQNGDVNGWDMMNILRQITGNISGWANKWIFHDSVVVRSDSNIVKDIYGICRGDVNASYFVQPKIIELNDTSAAPAFSLNDLRTGAGDTLSVSVRGKDLVDFGAITLKIQYDADSLKFVGASEWNRNITASMIGESEGVVTIAYANVNSETIKDDILVKLIFIGRGGSKNPSLKFVKNECEIASSKAVPVPAKFIDSQFTTVISRNPNAIPAAFSLKQNFPNPFNPVTSISYSIPYLSNVVLKIYDLLGREVALLVNDQKTAGNYKIQFDGSSLPSGVYIYTLKAGSYMESKKLIMLK